MWIQFSAENIAFTDQLREWAESRLWMALQPYEEQARWAIGQLRDEPRTGGVRCEMQAMLFNGQTIAARQFDDDPYQAASAAAEELQRRLARHLRSLRGADESAEESTVDSDEPLMATA